jgi:hypothetical protein
VLSALGDESASAVVMDCRNGEVLAMATNPSFDPSVFNSGVSQAQWLDWTNDRRTPLINKAASGLYAPGSTFKMAVALAGIESKAITPADRIECPGYLDLGDTRFHCWRKGGHGALDLRGGLKNSCYVVLYEVARRTRRRYRRDGAAVPDHRRWDADRPALPPPVRPAGRARNSCNFFLYVFVNIAMVMGVIPVGGVPLPLVSHGGSAMLTVMVGFGILVSVHAHRNVVFPAMRDDR